MANILLLDDSDVAGRAMRGILGRAGHRCLIAGTPEQAWALLRQALVIDLAFVELNAGGATGMTFVARVRQDPFAARLPVVVYTVTAEPPQIHAALRLQVQNYLVKPCDDEAIYAEVAKARANAWRDALFAEPDRGAGAAATELSEARRAVMTAFEAAAQSVPGLLAACDTPMLATSLQRLGQEAAAASIPAAVEFIRALQAAVENQNWPVVHGAAGDLAYAAQLISCHLNPGYLPAILRADEEAAHAREQAERARWLAADVDASGPFVSGCRLREQVAALAGCPVLDGPAAAFLMAANGRASGVSRVMELAHDDPGVCAQVLITANRLRRDAAVAIDDPAAAVELLGEVRLAALAQATLVIDEQHLLAPPLSWPNYWIHLVGVARVSRLICEYLDFRYLAGTAYTAGLLHDIGRLLLLRLQPPAFVAIAAHARHRKIPLREAERKFLGCTTRDLAIQFAAAHGLPAPVASVIRWLDTPEAATEHAELVAIVALARHVCLHNHIGQSGEAPAETGIPIAHTGAWRVLQPRLFPSFDLHKFEAQAHAFCRELRPHLLGADAPAAGGRGARAAGA